MIWACERFRDYIINKDFSIETDHKPVVTLLKINQLDDLPVWIQRFRMRLMQFNYTVFHTAGKNLVIVDTLSKFLGHLLVCHVTKMTFSIRK